MGEQKQAEAWTLNPFRVQASACLPPYRYFETLLALPHYYLVWIWREEVEWSQARIISAANAGFNAFSARGPSHQEVIPPSHFLKTGETCAGGESQRKQKMNAMKRKGFTLIELLIVVAIFAILAAIAVPNFLEAQVRSKIARVRADERTAATALEAYCVDYNQYPDTAYGDYTRLYIQYATQLTTPVAYVTTTDFKDPFSILQTTAFGNTGTAPDWRETLNYFAYSGWWALNAANSNYGVAFYPKRAYAVFSNGPSRLWSVCEHIPYIYESGHPLWVWSSLGGGLDVWCNGVYEATNGTKSYGGIVRYGGDLHVPQP